MYFLRYLTTLTFWGTWPRILSKVLYHAYFLRYLTTLTFWGTWPRVLSEVLDHAYFLRYLTTLTFWGTWPRLLSEVLDHAYFLRYLTTLAVHTVIDSELAMTGRKGLDPIFHPPTASRIFKLGFVSLSFIVLAYSPENTNIAFNEVCVQVHGTVHSILLTNHIYVYNK